MRRPRCVIVGAGGHAAVLIDAMRLQGKYEPVCALDPKLTGKSVLDVPVVGNDDDSFQLREEGISHFAVGVGPIRDNRPRRDLFESYLSYGFTVATVVHPGAYVSSHADVGAGSILLAGVVLNARARVGRNVILNSGCIVEHDCQIGDHVHISPGARLGGGVSVGVGAFVGLGACVIPKLFIGDWVMVGAGSVVLRDVDDGERVLGLVKASGS